MILLVLSYLAGVLTIISGCILPVLPFVFARAGEPFLTGALPLLGGMAVTFAGVGSLVSFGGGWAIQANAFGRMGALLLLAFFGSALLLPSLADRLCQPLVRLGDHLASRIATPGPQGRAFGSSLLIGVAVGLLWAPCAGPILGLIFTTAALQGANAHTALFLLAYALGAVTSLGLALLAGKRVAVALRQGLGASGWLRRLLGASVLAAVGANALGVDQASLARFPRVDTNRLEKGWLAKAQPRRLLAETAAPASSGLPVLGTLPPFPKGAVWLNSPPLTRDQLWGKVVLVDIWTYSCINCQRTLPHVRAWARKYGNHGLVVIGVHSPEFAFERELSNVREASRKLGVTFPIVIDNDFAIWKAFRNTYWPSFYFIDGQGRIRHTHFGEGSYETSERTIQLLLKEAGRRAVPGGLVQPDQI